MPRLKRLFALSITFLGVFLAACGGRPPSSSHDWGVGLDAIAPNGRWATIVEQNGEPPTCHLTLVELGENAGKTYRLDESVPCISYGIPLRSSFSPDSNYLLYRISGGWGITEITEIAESTTPTKVATDQEQVQFLPNGRLLITSTTYNLTGFFEAAPDAPTDRTLLIGQVRYIFSSNQFPPDIAVLSACADPSLSEHASWVTIDAGNKAAALVATRASGTLKPRPLDFPGLTKLVTETEKLVGVPSPDGTRLLLLQSRKINSDEERYTLTLFDLETGALLKELSTESDQEPRFAFSPDGRHVLYESTSGPGGPSLYLANSDGSDPQPVGRDMVTPCWYQ